MSLNQTPKNQPLYLTNPLTLLDSRLNCSGWLVNLGWVKSLYKPTPSNKLQGPLLPPKRPIFPRENGSSPFEILQNCSMAKPPLLKPKPIFPKLPSEARVVVLEAPQLEEEEELKQTEPSPKSSKIPEESSKPGEEPSPATFDKGIRFSKQNDKGEFENFGGKVRIRWGLLT